MTQLFSIIGFFSRNFLIFWDLFGWGRQTAPIIFCIFHWGNFNLAFNWAKSVSPLINKSISSFSFLIFFWFFSNSFFKNLKPFFLIENLSKFVKKLLTGWICFFLLFPNRKVRLFYAKTRNIFDAANFIFEISPGSGSNRTWWGIMMFSALWFSELRSYFNSFATHKLNSSLMGCFWTDFRLNLCGNSLILKNIRELEHAFIVWIIKFKFENSIVGFQKKRDCFCPDKSLFKDECMSLRSRFCLVCEDSGEMFSDSSHNRKIRQKSDYLDSVCGWEFVFQIPDFQKLTRFWPRFWKFNLNFVNASRRNECRFQWNYCFIPNNWALSQSLCQARLNY